jgi:hypothetical protein
VTGENFAIMADNAFVPMNNTLFGCTEDCGDCLHASYCGPCHLGSIAQRAQSGDCYGTCLIAYAIGGLGCYPCYAQSVLQNALLRVGVTQPIAFFEWCCCTPCLQCQVSREVNARQAAAAVAGQQPQVIVVQAPAAQVAQK